MTRLVAVAALAFAACVDTIEQPDPSCIDIEQESKVVDLGNLELVMKYDGSIPMDVGGSFYACESLGALHVYGLTRLSKEDANLEVAIQRRDGTCRFAPVDRIQTFNGEICE